MVSQPHLACAVAPCLLLALSAACAGSRPQGSDVQTDAQSGDSGAHSVDSGTKDPSLPAEVNALCETQMAELQFYATRMGGEPIEAGAQLLLENGQYVIVRGNCDFIVYRETGQATTGHLSDKQRESLAQRFPRELFATKAGTYTRSGCGPSDFFSMDGRRIDTMMVCPSAPMESPLARELAEGLTASLRELVMLGEPSTGDVRYTIVLENRPIPPGYLGYRKAQPWPLASPIESTALDADEAENYEAGTSQLATGADAAALRSLRTRFLSGEIGFEGERFIPIEATNGTRYRLFVRDAIELENEQGLLPWRR